MIKKLFHDGLRGLPSGILELSTGITVVSGKNGCGKTTLLEAVFLLTQGFSFRAKNLHTLVSWGKSEALLRGEFIYNEKSSVRALQINAETFVVKKDSENFRSPAVFFGEIPAVMMQPSDIELVKGTPELRRRWFDEILCYQSKGNADLLRRYRRILSQRNQWLNSYKQGKPLGGEDVFVVLSKQLVSLGAALWKERFLLSEQLEKLIPHYYEGLSKNAEKVSCSYRTTVNPNENLEEQFLQLLEKNEDAERRLGVTLSGPQRDDFVLWIDGYEMRQFGSQGQCRSSAIAMRLAAIDLVSSRVKPILLLDDVLAELDSNRRLAISEIIREKECQVFVATPQEKDLPFVPENSIHLG